MRSKTLKMSNQVNINKDFIPHSRPSLGQEEIDSVSRVIASSQIAQGEVVHEFEQALAAKMGVGHAACTSSGTSALHLVLMGMGIGAQDEVILPSYVCTALLNAVFYVGATPILADIVPETYNIDPDDVKRRLTQRTKAIIVPHLFGLAANLESLLELNVPIIEDCAQAVGSTYQQKYVGAFGEAAIFSFYATKVMTTGEGGMVVSNSKGLIDRVRDLREYDNQDHYKIGYNYKMTDIHAAVGLAQLPRLDTFIQRRRAIAELYDQAFNSLGLQLPTPDQGHIYYRYVIGLGTDSKPWIRALGEQGIGSARPVYLPLHNCLNLKGYPQTEKVWGQALSIPIYPSLTEKNIHRVIERSMQNFTKIARDEKI